MTREEKDQEIAELRGRFERATVTLVAEPKGLTVAKVRALRRAIRQAGGEYKVAKNTLAKRAIADTNYQRLDEILQGPTGLVFGYEDPVAVTKALVKFTEENDKVTVKAAVLERELLNASAVGELAKLPSREVLIGMLLGLMQAPATQLLRTIQEPGASLARLIDRVRERLESNA